jgi:alpha-glucosidase
VFTSKNQIPQWLKGVIYQIYLRSFQDSNEDGLGDLNGIRQRLDYLSWLGVSALWLSPFHPSPWLDSGYDVSDFTAVHPSLGDLNDFDRLLAECHRRQIRIILDYVGNHTSDQHPWFVNSSSSRASAQRAWYYWQDPAADGGPPNNWLNEYGQSAWTWHPPTEQYYLHAFLAEQPDLNWRNAEVRAAMKAALRFWLDRGVDGIRIDALPWMLKDEHFRNNPPNPQFQAKDPARQVHPTFTQDQSDLPAIIRELRDVIDEYEERALLGEIRLALERFPTYYEAGLHFPLNYQLLSEDLNSFALRKIIDSTEGLLGHKYWPNWLLGTHDESRLVTRQSPAVARLMALLLLTLRGTPVIYYGEELGLPDTELPPELMQDTYERLLPGRGRGRDPQRTPMPWDNSPGAGFSPATPWLPLGERSTRGNVEQERAQPDSFVNFYHRLIALRKRPAFQEGVYVPGEITAQGFSFQRVDGAEAYQIGLNFSAEPWNMKLAAARGTVIAARGKVIAARGKVIAARGTVIADTHQPEPSAIQSSISLAPWQGIVIQLSPAEA